MGFITDVLNASLGAGVGMATKAARNPIAAGTVVGGAAGFATSEANTLTQRFQDTGKGAMMGAAAGAFVPGSAAGIYSKLWKNKSALAKKGWGATKMAGKAAAFALENPLLVGGVAGGLYGASRVLGKFSGQTLSTPTMEGAAVNANYDQQAMQSEEMRSMFVNPPGLVGSAPEYQQQMSRLVNSTSGLVQGLHSGRHG